MARLRLMLCIEIVLQFLLRALCLPLTPEFERTETKSQCTKQNCVLNDYPAGW